MHTTRGPLCMCTCLDTHLLLLLHEAPLDTDAAVGEILAHVVLDGLHTCGHGRGIAEGERVEGGTE